LHAEFRQVKINGDLFLNLPVFGARAGNITLAVELNPITPLGVRYRHPVIMPINERTVRS
jgi:hypothetical protein